MLYIDSADFLSRLVDQTVITELHGLTLDCSFNPDGSPEFLFLLKRIPSLVDLYFGAIDWPEPPEAAGVIGLSRLREASRKAIDFAFPLTHLPNKRRLTCPVQFAYALAGPHSLEEISFSPLLSYRQLNNHYFVDNANLHLSEGAW